MKIKNIISLLTAVSVLGIETAAFADETGVSLTVNGTSINTDAEIVNDRTMVPLRALSSALGCGVAWDADNSGITVYRMTDGETVPDSLILCWIGRGHAFRLDGYALGESAVMDTPPMIIDDKTYIPIRAAAELLGCDVSWDGDTRTVSVTGTVTTGATDEFTESLMDYEKAMLEKYDAYSDYADGTPAVTNARITLEGGDTIDLELYPELAPETVANFVKLAESGYYSGLIFHRVISGFMIQGGGMNTDGELSNTDTIRGEFISNGYFNVIPHNRGVISMARATDKNSASGQFFIMHADYPYLNGDYAAFGAVTAGLETVDRIAAAETDENDKPLEDFVIERIDVLND